MSALRSIRFSDDSHEAWPLMFKSANTVGALPTVVEVSSTLDV